MLAEPADCNDVLGEFAHRLAQRIQGISLEIIEVENEIRRDYGGDRYYIPRKGEDFKAHLSARNQRIYDDWRAGEREPLLARRYNCTERRIRQVIAMKRAEAAKMKPFA